MTKRKKEKLTYKLRLRGKYSNIKKYAIIDIEDKKRVKKHSWFVQYSRNSFYVAAKKNNKIIKLHNFILKFTPTKTKTIDHFDREPSNNSKSNLRIVDRTIQNTNHNIQKNNKTGVVGVYHYLIFNKKENKTYYYWSVSWNKNKKKKVKRFSYIDERTFKEAFIKAVIFRKDKEREIKAYIYALGLNSNHYSKTFVSKYEHAVLYYNYIEKYKHLHRNIFVIDD